MATNQGVVGSIPASRTKKRLASELKSSEAFSFLALWCVLASGLGDMQSERAAMTQAAGDLQAAAVALCNGAGKG